MNGLIAEKYTCWKCISLYLFMTYIEMVYIPNGIIFELLIIFIDR